jgi:quinolinate synthase
MPAGSGAREAIVERIATLRRERHAVILAHNYQLGEVQDIADYVGDSLELSRKAAATDAEVIVFCGVHFMAETAAILSPRKTVLLPSPHADCPMARMLDAEALRGVKREHPGAAVVCYVNTTAEVKAECDICCTSANAVQVIARIPADREIIFVPDQYLGAYVQHASNRSLILWPGYCPTHARILPRHILERREQFPDAKVIVHPECRPEVTALADAVLSTGGMCRYVRETSAEEIIVGTEVGMIHRLRKEAPGKRFIPATEQAICPNMKQITLDEVLWSLEELEVRITVPEAIRARALAAVERMIEVTA